MYGCVFYYYYLLSFRSFVLSAWVGVGTNIYKHSQSVSQLVGGNFFSTQKANVMCICVFYHFCTHIKSVNVISVHFCFARYECINMQMLNNSGCIIWYNFAIRSCHRQERKPLSNWRNLISIEAYMVCLNPTLGQQSVFIFPFFVLYTNCLCWRLASSS